MYISGSLYYNFSLSDSFIWRTTMLFPSSPIPATAFSEVSFCYYLWKCKFNFYVIQSTALFALLSNFQSCGPKFILPGVTTWTEWDFTTFTWDASKIIFISCHISVPCTNILKSLWALPTFINELRVNKWQYNMILRGEEEM